MDLPRHNCCNPPKSCAWQRSKENLQQKSFWCRNHVRFSWTKNMRFSLIRLLKIESWRFLSQATDVYVFFFTIKQLPSLEENELKKHLSSLSSLTLSARAFFFPYFPRLGRGLCFWTLGSRIWWRIEPQWHHVATTKPWRKHWLLQASHEAMLRFHWTT